MHIRHYPQSYRARPPLHHLTLDAASAHAPLGGPSWIDAPIVEEVLSYDAILRGRALRPVHPLILMLERSQSYPTSFSRRGRGVGDL